MKTDQVVVAATTAQVLMTSTLQPWCDASAWAEICLHADVLAGAETVLIYQRSHNTDIIVNDRSTGAQAKLTATEPSLRLAGGVEYRVTKSATAGACGVYMTGINPTTR